MKPFETGCEQGGDGLHPSDATELSSVAFPKDAMELVCPYRFHLPLAPKVAAQMESVTVEFSRVIECFNAISDRHDLTLVEGAGGLLVPICDNRTYADLAKALGTPVLLVVANKLGAINHTLLTVEVAQARGLEVLGYVLNQTEPGSTPAMETNGCALREMTDVPCLGEIPFLGEGGDVAHLFRRFLRFDLNKVSP